MSATVYQRAEQALETLCNNAIRAVLDDIDAAIVRQWREERDPSRREGLFYRQQALRELHAELLDRVEQAAQLDARTNIQNSPWRKRWEHIRQGRYDV